MRDFGPEVCAANVAKLAARQAQSASGPNVIEGVYEIRREAVATTAAEELARDILVAVCERDGLSLDSGVEPGTPARNYELAVRLGIGHVFGLEARDGGG